MGMEAAGKMRSSLQLFRARSSYGAPAAGPWAHTSSDAAIPGVIACSHSMSAGSTFVSFRRLSTFVFTRSTTPKRAFEVAVVRGGFPPEGSPPGVGMAPAAGRLPPKNLRRGFVALMPVLFCRRMRLLEDAWFDDPSDLVQLRNEPSPLWSVGSL